MSAGNTTENDLMLFIFNATALSGSWPAGGGNFYVALHTADPGEAGSPTTSEATYGGYARVAVTRNSAGWTVSGNQASNTAVVTFPQCTSGSNTITYASLVSSASGAGQLFISGALTTPLNISTNITPSAAIGQIVFTLD